MANNNLPKGSNNKLIPIIGVVVALIMLVSFVLALSKFSKPGIDVETSEEPSKVVEESSKNIVEESSEVSSFEKHEYYDKLNFENLSVRNDEIVNGPLAAIKDDSKGYPYIDQSKMVKISNVKTPQVYGLANTSLSIYSDAIKGIDPFIVEFYNNVPKNGMIISKAYVSGDSISPADGIIDLTTGYSVQFGIYNTSYKFTDDDFSFLPDQAYKYGVIQRYPVGKEQSTNHSSDYSIYRYVGVAHSAYMKIYNLSLEEYLDKLRTEKVIEFETDLAPDTVFVSYYIPTTEGEETTNVKIPEQGRYEYTISGDGTSGFIVTVSVKTTNIE